MKNKWYLQIQDDNYNVLLLNHELGEYKKFNKFTENKVNKIVSNFPNAKRWEGRIKPYTSRVVI